MPNVTADLAGKSLYDVLQDRLGSGSQAVTRVILCAGKDMVGSVLFQVGARSLARPPPPPSPSSYSFSLVLSIPRVICSRSTTAATIAYLVDHSHHSSFLPVVNFVLFWFSPGFADGSSAEAVSASFHAVSSQGITGGCIIVSNTAVVAFMEGPVEAIHTMLQGLQDSGKLSGIRVVSSTEDCQARIFEQFGSYSFNPANEDGVDVGAEGAAVVASGIQQQIANITFPEVQPSSTAITSLPKTNANSVPSATRTIACSKSSLFPDVEEYLEIYGSKVMVVVESEQVWPLQSVVSWK